MKGGRKKERKKKILFIFIILLYYYYSVYGLLLLLLLSYESVVRILLFILCGVIGYSIYDDNGEGKNYDDTTS